MTENPIITLKQGQLKGKIDTTKTGYKFNTFYGIPYAKPPLGTLRFKAPVPAEPWQGIRDATQEGEQCYCYDLYEDKVKGSEDCLFVNVYTPELPSSSSKPKPVMVWIHGGGYLFGSGNREQYGPEYLIENDIVLVTFNYRLGALGFLSLDDKSLGVTGNAGMIDQVLALKWIQKNIQQFGGDPNNVTIFGESAGAGSVHLHILSPMSKGLFHKAIMQSGSANCPWSFGQKHGYYLAGNLGEEPRNDSELLEILQKISKEELLQAQNRHPDNWKPCDVRIISPVIDGCFLQDDPLKIIKSGAYNKVPIIMGYNSAEGLMLKMIEYKMKAEIMFSDFEEAIPFTYGVPKGTAKSKAIGAKIKEFYYGKEEPNKDNKHNFIKIMSDTYFVRSIYATLEETLKTSNDNLYLYRLSLECELNGFSRFANIIGEGVSHADDLFYLFHHSVLSPAIKPGSIEDLSIQRMTKWWTNFAKHGNPNGMVKDPLFPVEWPTVDAKTMKCLDINNEITIQEHPEGKYMKFWKSIEELAGL